MDHPPKQASAETTQPEPAGDPVVGLVREHQAALLRYARRLVRNEEAAQDLVQEAFARYLKARLNGSPPREASNWLFRVTHHLAVDQIRKETRMRNAAQIMDVPPPAPPPSAELEKEEDRRRIGKLLTTLNENQRAVVVLKFEESKSYKEISKITGLSVSNVGFLLHQAIKKLGRTLAEEETT